MSHCLLESLKSLPFLSCLPESEAIAAVRAAHHRRSSHGSYVLEAGARSEGLHLLLRGTLNLLIEETNGRELITAVLRAPDFFGEEALLSGETSPVSAVSDEDSELMCIPREMALRWLREYPDINMHITRMMAHRLLHAQRKIAELAFVGVHGRVAGVLLKSACESDGDWRVERTCSQIGTMVGASREMVSRVIGHMAREGVVRRHKRHLLLLDRASLAKLTPGSVA